MVGLLSVHPATLSQVQRYAACTQLRGPTGSKDSTMDKSQLTGVLTPILVQFDLELEAVEVIPAGKRQLLRVVVDGDGATGTGPQLDDLAEASKALSAALDSSDAVGG